MTSGLATVVEQYKAFVEDKLDSSGLSKVDRQTYYDLIHHLEAAIKAAKAPLPVAVSRIRELAHQATPGPWEFRQVEDQGAVCHPKGWVDAVLAVGEQECHDARYIAQANPQAILGLLDALDVRGPKQLWGFFHTTCIYESAAALVSLHLSKREAWKAMHRAQWNAWEAAQAQGRLRGDRAFAREYRKKDPEYSLSKDSFWRKAYVYERSHVAPVYLQF